jgi:hypothetical protein
MSIDKIFSPLYQEVNTKKDESGAFIIRFRYK